MYRKNCKYLVSLVTSFLVAASYTGVTTHSTQAQSPEVAQRICQQTIDYIVNVETVLERRRRELQISLVGKSHPTLPGLDAKLATEDIDEWFSSLTTLRNDLRTARERLARLRQEPASAQRLSTDCFDLRSKAVTHYWETELAAAKYAIQASPEYEEGTLDASVRAEPRITALRSRLIAELRGWREEARSLALNSSMLAFNRQLEGRFNAGDDLTVNSSSAGPRPSPQSSPSSPPTVSNGAQEILQYHTENIIIRGENLPKPEGSVFFSDPALQLRNVVSASPQEVVLRVYAGPKAGARPVDVTFAGFTAKGVIKVRRIDGAVWLVERLVPVFNTRTEEVRFDFDLSLQLLSQTSEDASSSKNFQPIRDAKVAFFAMGEDTGVVGVSDSLDGLELYQTPWLGTNTQGKIYCRVRSRVGNTPPFIEARFGNPDSPTLTSLKKPFQLVSWRPELNTQGDANQSAFDALRRDGPPTNPFNDLVQRIFLQGEAFHSIVGANFSVEQIAASVEQLEQLIFASVVNGTMVINPVYAGIEAAVVFAQKALDKSTQNLEEAGFELGEFGKRAELIRRTLQRAVKGESRTIARAIYGGALLGSTRGSLNALYDQTLGTLGDAVDLGQWIVRYVKDNPRRLARQGVVRGLKLTLAGAFIDQGLEYVKKNRTDPRCRFVFNLLYDEAEKKEIEESEFAQIGRDDCIFFLLQVFPYVFNTPLLLSNHEVRFRVAELAYKGTLAALDGLDSGLELLRELMPTLAQDTNRFAKALGIEPGDPQMFHFKCGYFSGFAFGYVAGIAATELALAAATNGVGNFVKGSLTLAKLAVKVRPFLTLVKYGDEVIGMASLLTTLHDLFNKEDARRTGAPGYPEYARLTFEGNYFIRASYGWNTFATWLRTALTRAGARKVIAIFKIAYALADDEQKLLKLFTKVVDKNRAELRKILKVIIEDLKFRDLEIADIKPDLYVPSNRRIDGMIKALKELSAEDLDDFIEAVHLLMFMQVRVGAADYPGVREMGQLIVHYLPDFKRDELRQIFKRARELSNDPDTDRLQDILHESYDWYIRLKNDPDLAIPMDKKEIQSILLLVRTRGPPPANAWRIPRGGGAWVGEAGRSGWQSKKKAVRNIVGEDPNRPGFSSPIPFRNGFPDFSKWVRKPEVTLKPMLGTDADFSAADEEFARLNEWLKRNGQPDGPRARQYRETQELTWHHVEDGQTMQLVPTALHGNVPHLGGASISRELVLGVPNDDSISRLGWSLSGTSRSCSGCALLPRKPLLRDARLASFIFQRLPLAEQTGASY